MLLSHVHTLRISIFYKQNKFSSYFGLGLPLGLATRLWSSGHQLHLACASLYYVAQ